MRMIGMIATVMIVSGLRWMCRMERPNSMTVSRRGFIGLPAPRLSELLGNPLRADLLVRALFGCGVTWGCGVNSVGGECVAEGVEHVRGGPVSVKSSGTRVFSLFGLILGLVDPGLGRHGRRMGPTTEPRRVGMVGRRQGLLPGLVDRVGSPEMHR